MPATPPTPLLTSNVTWTDERIERLKSHFAAGLTCREIAADIGVSRNAVIGKLSRLNLTRGPKREERRIEARAARGLNALARLQQEMLVEIYAEAGDMPPPGIDEANRCSLLELDENRCRWPISTPGAEDFCFCGNTAPDGQPYCAGHSRLAYRPASQARLARG
jgi:GcrA cell cycle regulator